MTRVLRASVAIVLVAIGCAPARPPAHARVATERAKEQSLASGCGPSGAKYACSPITNAGCDAAAGEACDDDEHGGFGCYPAPNEVKEGGDCDDEEGPSCAPEYGCATKEGSSEGVCRKYCCDASDCAGGKNCVAVDAKVGTLGFCE